MDATLTDTVDMNGDPLAFRVRQGATPTPLIGASGRDTIKVEARQMAGHQKEAVVTEGENGSAWRLCSDEGKHLRGHDLAPFPLGFFNAGIQCDLYNRLRRIAAQRGVTFDDLEIGVVNHFWFTGSFVQGTAEAHVESPDIEVRVRSGANQATVEAIVAAALDASPAIALLRTPLVNNTFALYINGRRRQVVDRVNSTAPDATDPYRAYASAPRPLDPAGRTDLCIKTDQKEQGMAEVAPVATTGKLIRSIYGEGRPLGDAGEFAAVSWLGLPGNTHYRFVSDESDAGAAPCGLTLLSTAIAFCYMTQLSRYIENMKMPIHGVRLVQFSPYAAGDRAEAGAIDTHLFLNGQAPDELHLKLLTIAAHTCYLHVLASAPIEPSVRIVLNGNRIQRAA